MMNASVLFGSDSGICGYDGHNGGGYDNLALVNNLKIAICNLVNNSHVQKKIQH